MRCPIFLWMSCSSVTSKSTSSYKLVNIYFMEWDHVIYIIFIHKKDNCTLTVHIYRCMFNNYKNHKSLCTFQVNFWHFWLHVNKQKDDTTPGYFPRTILMKLNASKISRVTILILFLICLILITFCWDNLNKTNYKWPL